MKSFLGKLPIIKPKIEMKKPQKPYKEQLYEINLLIQKEELHGKSRTYINELKAKRDQLKNLVG